MSRFKSLRLGACTMALAALAAVSPANAAQVVFNMTGNTATSGTDGNALTYNIGGVRVRVTAWSLTAPNAGGTVYDSYLGAYSTGLGATSGDENGGSNTHTVDNQNRFDFLLFQFDQAVDMVSATFTTYAVGGTVKDSDFTYGFGNTNVAWNSQPNLNNQGFGTLSSLLGGGFTTVTGDSAGGTKTIDPLARTGNVWLIGAAFANADSKIDAFKISNVTVNTTAVPEPATWAMMIAGFGLVGGTMRRRRSLENLATA